MPYKGRGFAYQQYPTPKEDPVPTWDFENPGAKLRDYLEELQFWKRQGSVPPWKQGVKLYQSFKKGTVGRHISRKLRLPQIESEQGFDLLVEAIKDHFKTVMEAEPEVLSELAIYTTQRKPGQTYLEYTNSIRLKLAEFEQAIGETLPPMIKGFIIKR